MSQPKLTIIVTCTDRKSANPARELMVRHLPVGAQRERLRHWRDALARSTAQRPLTELYAGETWSQVRALALKARSLGYDPVMLVASAGLGLQHVLTPAPAYAATFSPGHPDSVGTTLSDSQVWWAGLPHVDVPPGGRAIWVLSEAYSRAVGQHLYEKTAPSDLLVFGGSREICDAVRIPPDRSLRRALGGTVTSLNVRSATQWLTLADGKDPFAGSTRAKWHAWAEASLHEEVFNRRPMSDSAVLEFVEHLRAQQPQISKTTALRLLREAGLACEQRRFSTLFQRAASK